MDAEAAEPLPLDAIFATFTLPQVLAAIGGIVGLPRSAKRNRTVLFQALESFSDTIKSTIRATALTLTGTKRKGKQREGPRKRRRIAPPEQESVADTTMDIDSGDLITGPFLRPATGDCVKECIVRAIDHTSNHALAKEICMACARTLFKREMTLTPVRAIPNRRHLIPLEPHPAHHLTEGLLLHEEALRRGPTYLCPDCKRKLILDERPPYALANNMWIGPVPFQLKILTLPEKILVSLYFPAAYVVKLHSKKAGAETWDKDSMNSGLKGNVSTYRLNTEHILDIVSGQLKRMPPSPRILAATIAVTFVGPSNKRLSVLPDIFNVRRARVFAALEWLKANNPLYAEIEISHEHLLLLPEDGVPEEITANARFSDDVGTLAREHESYVPVEVSDDERASDHEYYPGAASGVNPVREDDEMDGTGSQLQLHAHGVLDVYGDGVPDSDVYAHAFAHLAADPRQREFKIRRDSAFVNEYPRLDKDGQRFDGGPGNANHMLGAFPVLFPYGKGGLEVNRDVAVPYEAHVRWALRYADGRFKKDLYFMFQAFGVVQKREVCRSAALQIKRSTFIANQVAFLKLRPRDLMDASAEEGRRVPFSNPVVRKLRKHLTSLRARVMGTDESRIKIRSQIWGMNLRFNPPSIWATINLADVGDPVAQVLAGKAIDLDRFVESAGPTSSARAVNIAADPFAAAEFFHYTIGMLLEQVFGIKRTATGTFTRQAGILGGVNGYIGTVEAQGRGTLHLHILFWLAGALTSAEMEAALKSDAFREKVQGYIRATVRADVKGTTADDIFKSVKTPSLAYSRPEDPRLPGYELRRHEAESRLAKTVQYHDCTIRTCLVNRNGRLVCKRRCPFTIASADWVLPSGEWGPRRLCYRLNSWNPALIQINRCNHDIKLITNGHETKDIAFYITLYIAKKQIQTANASALLVKSMAFHKKMNARNRDCRDVNKRMLQQCANTLSRQQEFSAPEVVSYLMGWGDRFVSHTFSIIYWDEVTSALRRAFPDLEKRNVVHNVATGTGHSAPIEGFDIQEEPTLRLRVEHGVFVLKDQLKEYTDRGRELDDMCFHDYFVDTYHGTTLPEQDAPDADEEAPPARRRTGRPASRRVAYLPDARRKGCRVFRGAGYEAVPQFVGTWFPRSDAGEYYFACMLALLKPWRNLADLRRHDETFETSYASAMATAHDRAKRVVANIAYYHECCDGSKRAKNTLLAPPQGFVDVNDFVRRDEELAELNDLQVDLTEADVQIARDNRYPFREHLYAEHAMSVAVDVGVFNIAPLDGSPVLQDQASFEDLLRYNQWGKKVAALTRQELLRPANILETPIRNNELAVQTRPVGPTVVETQPLPFVRTAAQQARLDMLNQEQRLAHDIIESHLRRTIAGVKQEQLLMIVRGEGGTGKTVLLNAIADTFDFLKVPEALGKTATTGVAASLVGGQTVHGWAGIGIRADNKDGPPKPSPETIQKRKKNILPVKYLTVDEKSMLTKTLLAKLSRVIGETLDAAGIGDFTKVFGGTNLVLFGDFHQFPPVADTHGALYCESGSKPLEQLGMAIYRQFKTVVTLTEQKRITDEPWKFLLRRLRRGVCTEEDLATVRSLLVSETMEDLPKWDEDPWNQAVLVTPRHGVRTRWNTASVQKHCRSAGVEMYVCTAEDTVGRSAAPLNLEQRVLAAGLSERRSNKLAEHVELAVGMRAMVLTNIATEADLANGTRGVAIDFKLDPREDLNLERDPDSGALILRYPPAVVFFKPDHCTFSPFEGLPNGVLPIVPAKRAFPVETADRCKHQISRHQLPMTPAYAFTDYKSQGQTLEYVIIDLEPPSQGHLTPFSAYVALSRSRGRDRIRLLRGFDDSLFTTHPSEALRLEDARLDALSLMTKTLVASGRLHIAQGSSSGV